MRPRNGALVAVVVFVLAAFAWARAAQTDRGILAGTIKDPAGAAVPGVRVEAQGPVTASAVTDARGTFRIVNLVPGDYVVTARLRGIRHHDDASERLRRATRPGSHSNCASARRTKRRP